MYSMVLMAALTTGTDLPDFGCRGGCHGCWGCRGGCWGCYGGYGGYGWGGYGWGGYGWGGWGGWGGYGGYGYVYAPPVAVGYAAPTVLAYNALPAAVAGTTRSMYPDTSGNRATIVVHLPESAQLTVDGKPTTSASNTRLFHSPPLEAGKTYHYNFQARMERDGKTVKAEKRVDVSAGDRREITITMPDLNPPPERPQSAKPERSVIYRFARTDKSGPRLTTPEN